jgi:hypothetical protein
MRFASSLVLGALGFAVTSVAAFSVWAYGAGWFENHGGELAMYSGCTVVFVALSGLLLHPLLDGSARISRIYKTFIPAFLAYAVAWCVAWIAMRDRTGEWLGSVAGSVAFAAVLALMFRNGRAFLPAAVAVFLLHSAGYFIGSVLYEDYMHMPRGRMVWGVVYGLGFGAGIGCAYWAVQRRPLVAG